MLEDTGKVMGLKETASALLADGWQENGWQENGWLENVAWNGQENACLRDADASWMDAALKSSETALGDAGKASGQNRSRNLRWRSSASCCSSSAGHQSLGWRRPSGVAGTLPSDG